MGCCGSSLRVGSHAPEKPPRRARPPPPPPQPHHPRRPSFTLNAHQAAASSSAASAAPAPEFAEFSLAELREATGGFAAANIVSESGEKAPNLVYRGRLQGAGGGGRAIAVKKFGKLAWPDPKQFAVSGEGGCIHPTKQPTNEPAACAWILGCRGIGGFGLVRRGFGN